ncbi:MAG: hypothetical protein GX675_07040 [Erysipelotrichaceae bacterium]|nr:hypothetical protein [Erysipelotrichaceae bacterium]
MAFKYYNRHPKGIETSDCVVRAISTALDIDYLECRRNLNRSKRELGFNSYKETKFLYKHLEGYPRLIFKAIKGEPRIKADDFTMLHPKGTYIVKLAGHITCIIDGVILDTWDCGYRSVYTAWEVK